MWWALTATCSCACPSCCTASGRALRGRRDLEVQEDIKGERLQQRLHDSFGGWELACAGMRAHKVLRQACARHKHTAAHGLRRGDGGSDQGYDCRGKAQQRRKHFREGCVRLLRCQQGGRQLWGERTFSRRGGNVCQGQGCIVCTSGGGGNVMCAAYRLPPQLMYLQSAEIIVCILML